MIRKSYILKTISLFLSFWMLFASAGLSVDFHYCEGEIIDLTNEINHIVDYELGVGYNPANVSFYATDMLIGFQTGIPVEQVYQTTGALDETAVNVDSLEALGYNLTIPTTHLDMYAIGGSTYQNYLNSFAYNQTETVTFYGLEYTDANGCTSNYESYYNYDNGSFITSVSELSSPKFVSAPKPPSPMPASGKTMPHGAISPSTRSSTIRQRRR